jgi:hypothetical protein
MEWTLWLKLLKNGRFMRQAERPFLLCFRQVYFTSKLLESRVVAQAIQARVCVEANNQDVGTIVVSAGEPVESCVLVAEPGIHNRKVIRCDMTT